ncbi:MAG: hypothetical protein ACOY15_06695 [Pseudomonadota bacterium]
MDISDELADFCLGLRQDLFLGDPLPDGWIERALGFVMPDRRRVFRNYLEALIKSDVSDARLKDMFRSADTDMMYLDLREPRAFIAALIDAIDGKPLQL